MFPLTLHFHDSEVKHILQEQRRLRVVFSAARVSSTTPGQGGFNGYALGLELQLIGVLTPSPALNVFGRLSEGRLSVGGPARSSLVLPGLPLAWAGQTTLELVFSQGLCWSATALQVKWDWVDGERFFEGVGC